MLSLTYSENPSDLLLCNSNQGIYIFWILRLITHDQLEVANFTAYTPNNCKLAIYDELTSRQIICHYVTLLRFGAGNLSQIIANHFLNETWSEILFSWLFFKNSFSRCILKNKAHAVAVVSSGDSFTAWFSVFSSPDLIMCKSCILEMCKNPTRRSSVREV
jgi:hypothetical protein